MTVPTQGCFSLHSMVKLQSCHMLAHSNSTYWALHTPKDWYLQANLHKSPSCCHPLGAGASQGAWGAGTNRSQKLLWTHGNQHNGIDPNMLNWGPCLSLHSWQTAALLVFLGLMLVGVRVREYVLILFCWGWYRIWVVVVFCICFLCLGVYV